MLQIACLPLDINKYLVTTISSSRVIPGSLAWADCNYVVAAVQIYAPGDTEAGSPLSDK